MTTPFIASCASQCLYFDKLEEYKQRLLSHPWLSPDESHLWELFDDLNALIDLRHQLDPLAEVWNALVPEGFRVKVLPGEVF